MMVTKVYFVFLKSRRCSNSKYISVTGFIVNLFLLCLESKLNNSNTYDFECFILVKTIWNEKKSDMKLQNVKYISWRKIPI